MARGDCQRRPDRAGDECAPYCPLTPAQRADVTHPCKLDARLAEQAGSIAERREMKYGRGTTVVFAHACGDKVRLKALGTTAHVSGMMSNQDGKQYHVVWWLNGNRIAGWLFGNEIESMPEAAPDSVGGVSRFPTRNPPGLAS
jgi:hypothetical protein